MEVFLVGPAREKRHVFGIVNERSTQYRPQVNDRARFDVHHVLQASDFVFGQCILPCSGKVELGQIDSFGIVQVFFKVEAHDCPPTTTTCWSTARPETATETRSAEHGRRKRSKQAQERVTCWAEVSWLRPLARKGFTWREFISVPADGITNTGRMVNSIRRM